MKRSTLLTALLLTFFSGINIFAQNQMPKENPDSLNVPVFLVDGVEVQAQALDSISPDDIIRIEVLKDPGYKRLFAPRLGGVVILTTKSKKFLNPLLQKYDADVEKRELNRIPGQIMIR